MDRCADRAGMGADLLTNGVVECHLDSFAVVIVVMSSLLAASSLTSRKSKKGIDIETYRREGVDLLDATGGGRDWSDIGGRLNDEHTLATSQDQQRKPSKNPKQETHNLAQFPIRKANQNKTHYSSDACSNLYSIKILFISILC
ncbi:hypothetical protein L1887_27186 [Cichorium endivia]|nr:hypothetical protein L1887_27186 [Cichorium endivia]